MTGMYHFTSERSLMSVNFAKKDFQRKASFKSTSRQSIPKRSIMSGNFVKDDFHINTVYKSMTYTIMPFLPQL